MYLMLEYDIDEEFSKLNNDISLLSSHRIIDYYTESEEAVNNKTESFFNKIITKIRQTIERVKQKIIEFFSAKETNDKISTVENAVKNDPKLANKKVKITDYEKLNTLNITVQADLSKTDDIDKIQEKMDRYRKQRNTILLNSSLVTISLGTALAFITKNKNPYNM